MNLISRFNVSKTIYSHISNKVETNTSNNCRERVFNLEKNNSLSNILCTNENIIYYHLFIMEIFELI